MYADALTCHVLDWYSPTGRFGNPPSDPILVEQARPNQPDLCRNPYSHPRLLGRVYQIAHRSSVDPCVQSLEGDIHLVLFVLDRFRLCGHRKNSRLPRAVEVFPKLQLERSNGLLPRDPFLQIAPHAVGRLKYLFVGTTPDHLQDIADRLSCPGPLLKGLTILGSSEDFRTRSQPPRCTHYVYNLLVLNCPVGIWSISRHSRAVSQSLCRSTSRFLRKRSLPPQHQTDLCNPDLWRSKGRLVSLGWTPCINGFEPPSLLLDHLLIPPGAKMTTELDLLGLQIEDHLPRSLDNFPASPKSAYGLKITLLP